MAEITCTCGNKMRKPKNWRAESSTKQKDRSFSLFAKQAQGIIMQRFDDEVLVPDIYVCETCGRIQPVLNEEQLKKYKTINKSEYYE